MAVLTVQKPGAAITYAAVSANDEFLNDGKTLLHVKNQNAGTLTVTVNSQVNCNQGSDHDLTYTLTTATDKLLGPWDPARFNNANNRVEVAFDQTSSVTAAPIAAA